MNNNQNIKEKDILYLNKLTNKSPNIIYFFFSFLFIVWVFFTYRNIVHMDAIYIISSKIKHLYEDNLQITDFIYQPMFPAVISITTTFLNSKIFHLNTVIETFIGSLFLVLLGYKYLNEMCSHISNKRNKIFLALLIGFIVFGLHKWEASFTSFFSFAVYFNLCICLFSYFFLIKYIDINTNSQKHFIFPFIFSNLLVIIEAPAYYYSFILSAIILLFLIKILKLIEFDKKRWNIVFITSVSLFLITLTVTTYLSNTEFYGHYVSNQSITKFLGAFFSNPFWIIEFYLIANSGPYLGEAEDYIYLRAFFGLLILISYSLAIYYVFNKKDKKLLIPVSFIFHNLISYGFITMSRYTFNSLEYGAASRYTAFNLLGVLGLTTILFFYLTEKQKTYKKKAASLLFIAVIIGYMYVDIKQLKLSPYRTFAFEKMKESLLTKRNLEILQADPNTSLKAIDVLKKNKLNVYFQEQKNTTDFTAKLNENKSITLIVGTESYEKIIKGGFHENENGVAWTNGDSNFIFDSPIEVSEPIYISLDTYMPPICKDVKPLVSIVDENGNNYNFTTQNRIGDRFDFTFNITSPIKIKEIAIKSETIKTESDRRTLSFLFRSMSITKKLLTGEIHK